MSRTRTALILALTLTLGAAPRTNAATIHWTNPGLARFAVPCGDSIVRATLIRADVYRSPVGGTGAWTLLRSHAYATTPLTDSLQVPDVPAATYWVIPVNAAGESQCQTRGYTVGVPAVGVSPSARSATPGTYFDVAGRIVRPPLRQGVYLFRQPGSRTKSVVIVR